jgi:hypothetical protein
VAAAAGLCTGLCCYGYYAVRIFLPALLLAAVCVQPVNWRDTLRTRRGRLAVLAFVLGAAVTLGPLAASHLLDPATSKRGAAMLLWEPGDGPMVRASMVLQRYAAHFSPTFLATRGDTYPLHEIPGSGALLPALLPFTLLGAGLVLRQLRSSAGARLTVAWIVLYPLSDCFTRHPTAHLLRSSPGLLGFALLAGVGAAWALRRALDRNTRAVRAVALACGLLVVVDDARMTARFLEGFRERTDLYRVYNADLLEAARRSRRHLADVDAVFVSTRRSQALGQNFAVFLVGLDYAPEDWFRGPRNVERTAGIDVVHAFGKVHFLFSRADHDALRALEQDGRPQRVLFVARPEEVPPFQRVEAVQAPDGSPAFLLFTATL